MTNYRDDSKLRPATREWLALLKEGEVWVAYCAGCGQSTRVASCAECKAPAMCERCHAEHTARHHPGDAA